MQGHNWTMISQAQAAPSFHTNLHNQTADSTAGRFIFRGKKAFKDLRIFFWDFHLTRLATVCIDTYVGAILGVDKRAVSE